MKNYRANKKEVMERLKTLHFSHQEGCKRSPIMSTGVISICSCGADESNLTVAWISDWIDADDQRKRFHRAVNLIRVALEGTNFDDGDPGLIESALEFAEHELNNV